MGSSNLGWTNSTQRIGLVLIASILLTPVATLMASEDGAAGPEILGPYEELVRFRWELEGFSGGLLRFLPLVPSEGTGVLEVRHLSGNRVDYQFRASFGELSDENFWIFRSVVDAEQTRTLYVQDLRRFRGRQKIQQADLRDENAMDIIAGLHWLRVAQPKATQHIRAWADENFYQVEVVVHGIERLERDDRILPAEHYTIQGVKKKGERFWKPIADIWLRVDADRLPVEILYQKGMARVRLKQLHSARAGDVAAE